MERKEKGKEIEGKSQEGFMVKKLKGGFLVGKKAGPSTPPPTWRLQFTSLSQQQNDDDRCTENPIKEFLNFHTTAVSARKLCANLWEIEPHQYVPFPTKKMSKFNSKPRRRHPMYHVYDDLGIGQLRQLDEPEPPHSSLRQSVSANLLRKHGAAPALQRGRSIERHGCSQRPLSPASYSSSMEVAPYKPVATSTSSLDCKGKMRETDYGLKTSTELLKVLNHIWSLEEQHASNMALIKAMKLERDNCRARIKKLQQEKLLERQEMDILIKQVTDEKIVSKNKELDNAKAAVQSLKDELEDEGKLRKRSESLQRKLAQELSEVKSSFSIALRDLERERKARVLLENLCDEFAKGIQDYDQEVRLLRQKPAKSQVGEESIHRLVLHISEAWLDERMQMNQAETKSEFADKNTVVDKLAFDIETFLQAKRLIDTKRESSFSAKGLKEVHSKRYSVESLPLKEATSTPQNFAADENSVNAGSLRFDQKDSVNQRHSKGGITQDTDFAENREEKTSSRSLLRGVDSQDITNYSNFTSLEGELQENMVHPLLSNKNKGFVEGRAGEISNSFSPKSGKLHPETKCDIDPLVQSVITDNASSASAVESTSKGSVSNLRKSKSYLNLPMGVREHTLMAKLLEARLDRQQFNSKPSRLMES